MALYTIMSVYKHGTDDSNHRFVRSP